MVPSSLMLTHQFTLSRYPFKSGTTWRWRVKIPWKRYIESNRNTRTGDPNDPSWFIYMVLANHSCTQTSAALNQCGYFLSGILLNLLDTVALSHELINPFVLCSWIPLSRSLLIVVPWSLCSLPWIPLSHSFWSVQSLSDFHCFQSYLISFSLDYPSYVRRPCTVNISWQYPFLSSIFISKSPLCPFQFTATFFFSFSNTCNNLHMALDICHRTLEWPLVHFEVPTRFPGILLVSIILPSDEVIEFPFPFFLVAKTSTLYSGNPSCIIGLGLGYGLWGIIGGQYLLIRLRWILGGLYSRILVF